MASDEWTVEQVKAGVVPVWKISAPAGDSFGAPLVLCRTGEAQAVAWAQRHWSTPRTVVEIRWWNMRISADWVFAVTADILLAAALRVPGVVGAEAGSASEEWVVGLYGDVAADGSAGLEERSGRGSWRRRSRSTARSKRRSDHSRPGRTS